MLWEIAGTKILWKSNYSKNQLPSQWKLLQINSGTLQTRTLWRNEWNWLFCNEQRGSTRMGRMLSSILWAILFTISELWYQRMYKWWRYFRYPLQDWYLLNKQRYRNTSEIPNRNITGISQIRGKLAITKSGENCFPWVEVMDSQIGYFYGRQTTSFIKRYRFVFGASEISSKHCH